MKTRPSELMAVTLVLLFAAALRIIGMSYGEPDMRYFPADAAANLLPIEAPIHPDEFLYVTTPLFMRAKGTFDPDFFENPTFLINLNLLTYIATGTGDDLVWEEIKTIGQRQIAPFALYAIGRGYALLGGLLAVAAVYAAARLLGGRFAALCAGLIAAVSLPMVQHAHYATTSSLAAGFAALCVWASIVYFKRRRWGWFLLACAAAGLAATNRYNAAAVALVPAALGVMFVLRRQMSLRLLVAGGACVGLAFVAGSPYILRDFERFVQDFRYIYGAYAITGQGAMGMTPDGLFYEYRYLIVVALGVPASLTALIGAGRLASRRGERFALVALLAYLIPYSLVVLRTVRPSYSDQLLLPVIPVFAVLIGVGAAALARRFSRLTVMLPALLVISPLVFTLPVVQRFAAADTRLLMTAWISDHLPDGARVHLDGSYNVPLDRERFTVTQSYGGEFPALAVLCAADFVVWSDAWYHDMARSGSILDPAYLERVRTHVALLQAALRPIASIQRPTLPGTDLFMHTATYWHDPSIVVYAVPPTGCSGG